MLDSTSIENKVIADLKPVTVKCPVCKGDAQAVGTKGQYMLHLGRDYLCRLPEE